MPPRRSPDAPAANTPATIPAMARRAANAPIAAMSMIAPSRQYGSANKYTDRAPAPKSGRRRLRCGSEETSNLAGSANQTRRVNCPAPAQKSPANRYTDRPPNNRAAPAANRAPTATLFGPESGTSPSTKPPVSRAISSSPPCLPPVAASWSNNCSVRCPTGDQTAHRKATTPQRKWPQSERPARARTAMRQGSSPDFSVYA